MSIHEEYSLVRYDPRQGLLDRRAEGGVRPRTSRTFAPPRPYQNAAPASLADASLRPNRLHRMYSLRRTLETASAGDTGQIVDIFV